MYVRFFLKYSTQEQALKKEKNLAIVLKIKPSQRQLKNLHLPVQ